jgi:hypothetical protein
VLYLHDVWVNWFESEENGYQVAMYHEWRKEDKIELIDQTPLLYITEDLFNYIENGLNEIPENLLDLIYKRSYTRHGQNRNMIEYACVLTDGTEILAIDTIGYSIPVRKSRLIPRQEQLVYDMIEKTKQESFGFTAFDELEEYHLLSMSKEEVIGLTRREREIKYILILALDQLKSNGNSEEIRYWLTEWNPKLYPNVKYLTREQAWEKLYEGIREGYGKNHEEFCSKIIRGQPYLEKMWNAENGITQDTSQS